LTGKPDAFLAVARLVYAESRVAQDRRIHDSVVFVVLDEQHGPLVHPHLSEEDRYRSCGHPPPAFCTSGAMPRWIRAKRRSSGLEPGAVIPQFGDPSHARQCRFAPGSALGDRATTDRSAKKF